MVFKDAPRPQKLDSIESFKSISRNDLESMLEGFGSRTLKVEMKNKTSLKFKAEDFLILFRELPNSSSFYKIEGHDFICYKMFVENEPTVSSVPIYKFSFYDKY